MGQPFDTIKTKMQAQKGYENTGFFGAIVKTFRSHGIPGLYRGAIPPFLGSAVFRSVQFGSYNAVHTYLGNDFGKYTLPFSGLQLRVIIGGMCSGICRAVFESPLDYMKINRQLHRKWNFRDVLTGISVTSGRNMLLMTTFFVTVDSGNRNFPELFKAPFVGAFMKGGIAAAFAWLVVWPLDVMKTQVQGNYGDNVTVFKRMQQVAKENGIRGLYRGLMPGLIRSFVANGFSMIVMDFAQRTVTEWGWRD